MEHLRVRGSAVLQGLGAETSKGRWVSGEGWHLAVLGWEKRLKQGQEAESWGKGVL